MWRVARIGTMYGEVCQARDGLGKTRSDLKCYGD